MPNTRTLLVIAGEFPPLKTIGRIRTVKFVDHLRAHGWKAIVVTLEPSGREPNYDAKMLSEIADGVEVVRIPLVDIESGIARLAKRMLRRPSASSPSAVSDAEVLPAKAAAPSPGPSLLDRSHGALRWLLKNFVYIPDNYAPWARQATKVCLRLCAERRIDVVYTTLPPFSSAAVGYEIRKRTGLPWVADYRDLWYGDVLREWLPAWRKRLELRIERRLLQAADMVVTVSEPKTEYMRKLHPAVKGRWETLTNGYDVELYDSRERKRPVGEGGVEFVYTGRLFKNRRGYAFADALGRIHATDRALAERVKVRILGGVDANIRARYDEILARHGIAHLYDFAGDVSYAAAMNAQVNCDYLLLIVDTGETSDGVIPGATQEIIERAGLGKAVPAESADAVEAMLREWLAKPVPEKVEADDAYLAQFDRRAITARFAVLLDDLVAQPRQVA